MLLLSAPALAEQSHRLCLACHPVHYAERGGCSSCHRGNPASDRKNIAHAGLVAGKYARYTLDDPQYLKGAHSLLDQYSCRRCHISNGRGNRLAANLDASVARKSPSELDNSILLPVNNMPDFRLNKEQTTLLVNAILAGSHSRTPEVSTPAAVHFSNAKNKNTDVFTRTCGSCHRLLSEHRGALGAGKIGPDLSGLFSVNYPKNYRVNDSWTPHNLSFWLKNPREVQLWSRMRPVRLTADELNELESILQISSGTE